MKVKPFKIPKSPEDKLTVQIDEGSQFYNSLHEHQEVQLSYIIAGHGTLIVSDSIHNFDAGDIFIIGGHIPHLFQSAATSAHNRMISIFFTKDGFGRCFFELPGLLEIGQSLDSLGGGQQIVSKQKAIGNMMLKLPKASKFEQLVYFLKLLQKVKKAEKKELTGFISSKKISISEGKRLRLVFDYVMKHFYREITLTQISNLAHMTPPAFCRFFKQHTNKTFFAFLIELRIAHACKLLMLPDKLAIAEISEQSGFQSVSNFNRKFKKIKKMTPSAYKSNMLKQ